MNNSDWLCHQYNLDPLYIILDQEAWDEKCQETLRAIASDKEAFEAISLMMFGGNYSTEKGGLTRLFGDPDFFLRIAQKWLRDPSNEKADASIRVALAKALNRCGSPSE